MVGTRKDRQLPSYSWTFSNRHFQTTARSFRLDRALILTVYRFTLSKNSQHWPLLYNRQLILPRIRCRQVQLYFILYENIICHSLSRSVTKSTYVSLSTLSFASFLLSLKMCLKQCMNCMYVVGPTNTPPVTLAPPLCWCFKLIFSSKIDNERGSLVPGSSGGDSALLNSWSSPAQGIWRHSRNTWPCIVDSDATTLSL